MYGLDVALDDDYHINMFKKGIESSHMLTPDAVLESFPFLAHLPSWLPLMGFLREIEGARQLTHDLRNIPWKDAMKQIVRMGLSLLLQLRGC